MKVDYESALVRLLSYTWTALKIAKTKKQKDHFMSLGLINLEQNVGEKEYNRLLAEDGIFVLPKKKKK